MFLALSAYNCLTQVSQVLNQSLSLWERLTNSSIPFGERFQVHPSPFGRGKVRAFT